MTLFSKWSGPDGIEAFIIAKTGCKPYSGAGINPRIHKKTTILRSVDDTYYYQDDMSDIEHIQYTLFGDTGDQDENEPRFNEPLLNIDKTRDIYVYRVRKNGKKTEYVWYGKYEIENKENKQHIGKDYVIRTIVVLSLRKIND
jgi:hypothetical protein